MKTINANQNRTEHIVYDRDLSVRAGYTVQSVRLDEYGPATEAATISNLGYRFEITNVRTGASTMVWWDED